jgi:hypothetical protein
MAQIMLAATSLSVLLFNILKRAVAGRWLVLGCIHPFLRHCKVV